jgi:hypothetical protein
MAITNPQAISFSDQRLRRAADKLAQAYYFAKIVKQEWDANSMSSLITNTSDVIRDGASPSDDNGTGGDGRHVVTGAEATAIVTRCNDFITDYEATNNAKLNTILAVAVNPNPQ